MEKDVERRLDSVLEHEIAKGFRIKELPIELVAQLQSYKITEFTRFRLTRMNPARRRKLSEAVQRSYHRDLQTPEILSEAQIMKLVVERGEWDPEREERIKELQRSTNASMSGLYLEGFTNDTSEWASDILEQSDAWRAALDASELSPEDKVSTTERFNRWIEYAPEKQADYTAKYAASQTRDEYSPDADAMFVCDRVPTIEAVEAIGQLETLLDKAHRFVKLTEERQSLSDLQLRKARIFSDSVEARRENSEEMARLYYTCERVDAAGMPTGPLMPTFEALYDFPDDVIQFMLVESYFFHNGIPDEARPYLETFGFIRAEPGASDESSTPMPLPNSGSEPSVELPAPQNSSSDSLAAVATE